VSPTINTPRQQQTLSAIAPSDVATMHKFDRGAGDLLFLHCSNK